MIVDDKRKNIWGWCRILSEGSIKIETINFGFIQKTNLCSRKVILMDLEDNNNYDSFSPKSKNKTISEFLLILRDRWLLAVTLALPFSLFTNNYKFLSCISIIFCINTSSSNFKFAKSWSWPASQRPDIQAFRRSKQSGTKDECYF